MRGQPTPQSRSQAHPPPARLTDDTIATAQTVTAPDPDTVLDSVESDNVALAISGLPRQWQAVLWYVDMEGMDPAAAAPLLGISPNAVSALTCKAREGLRQNYLRSVASSHGEQVRE
jgi:DNA-directed RNA polymerase specialized sigma24 family protein